eukprot:COSAG01_NODE_7436_length_3212_cov_8.427241_3_plen_165_part_00
MGVWMGWDGDVWVTIITFDRGKPRGMMIPSRGIIKSLPRWLAARVCLPSDESKAHVCACACVCVLILIVPRAGEVPPTCVGHALANLFLRMERTPGLRSLPMRCPEVMHFIARCQDELPREDGHALLQQRAERQRQQDANEFLSKLLCGASSTPTLIVRRVVEK